MDTANVMQSRVLPAEVCARIVRYAYRGDLPALCRTSKLFQEHAEARLYQEITLQDPRVVSRICGSLLAHEGRRASYLRRFWVSIETRPFLRVPVSEQFWRLISDVLPKADNLELLLAWNPEVCSSLLMDPTSVHFQLRDAIFQLSWDKHLVAFLQTQRKIHSLTISGVDVQADDNGTTRIQPISSDCLPELITYEGPLEVATELLSRPLRHVQAQIMDEDGDVLLTFLAKAARSSKTLRSLNAIVIPEFLVCDVLRILADSPLSEHLRHLGVLALPLSEVGPVVALAMFITYVPAVGTLRHAPVAAQVLPSRNVAN
ncbi:hypothetical protein NM688_g5277 [Phlebia brevispora]|uniref:Uncharacterized protein n=1 Tax=Phlebia brevispora TaxID=194682 RepID=A0ACC1SY17_9APHY|nr:hypothetical protein NM688_g5277 [Phlebia brevispora]